MTINEITMHGTRSFHRALNNLQPQEQRRCHKTIKKFNRNLRLGGLNFELLDKGSQHRNHHSIRVSDELRLILGVEPDIQKPQQVVFVYAGHHDAAYRWSENHGWHTDVESVELYDDVTGDDVTGQAKQDKLPLQKFIDMEEWQLFLHDDQKELVHKKFFGEARIVGVAGSGKTVLALHRVAYLGEIYPQEKVLFATYSKSLCTHLKYLYEKLPRAANNVEFHNIHNLATRAVANPKFDPQSEKEFFNAAYRETIPGTVLEKLPRYYLKDEIERVIKGRDASRDEYLDTGAFHRTGRKRSFKRDAREICWRLKESWDARLRDAGLTAFADVTTVARDKAQQQTRQYRAIVVDEYQDLTLVEAQFLRALVCGSPNNKVPDNGLVFFGDAAQNILAGGWTAAASNLKFKSRGDATAKTDYQLTQNYRNTRRIIEAANAVRGGDGNDSGNRNALPKQFDLGDGERPKFIKTPLQNETSTIAAEIKKLTDDGLELEAIGIFMRRNDDANQIAEQLEQKGIGCFLLQKMRDQPPGAGVRVGTFDRSKGMEFIAVFLPRLGASQFPAPLLRSAPQQESLADVSPADLPEEEQEHRQLQLNRLYVGMTRAAKHLFLLADEEPCKELLNAEEYFDWR